MTATAPSTRQFAADDLGMPSYPVLVLPNDSHDGHIMGVTVCAWLARYPVTRWGDEWLHSGTLSLRFRSRLHHGDVLTLAIEEDDEETRFTITDAAGGPVTDGSSARSATAAHLDGAPIPRSPRPDQPLEPTPAALAGAGLGTLEMDFDADRDLAFLARLEADDPWRDLKVAPPAWLASAANALLKQTIAFTGGFWVHAGMALENLHPIESGTHLAVSGRVNEVFTKGTNNFAHVRFVVEADGVPSALLRHTIVYS
jgi:hypothetical protein